MEVKFYKNKENYTDVMSVRETVFIHEQGFSYDADGIDNHCTHVVFYDHSTPFATGRVFLENGNTIIGRVCVLKEYRGHNYGAKLIQELENKAKELGATSTHLGAQCQAKEFYAKMGYTPVGDLYYEEGCPHVHMVKEL